MDLLISHINSNPDHYSWKANTCMLQKHHPLYDEKECEKTDDSLVQLDEPEDVCLVETGFEKAIHRKTKIVSPEKQKSTFKKNPSSGQKQFGEKTDSFKAAMSKA